MDLPNNFVTNLQENDAVPAFTVQENAKIIVLVVKFVFSMSVIISSLACKCGGIMVKGLLFDGRQQRVRRPSYPLFGGRRTRC